MPVLTWLTVGFPRDVRRVAGPLAIALGLVCGSAVVAFVAARGEPELARALLPRALRESIESLSAGTPLSVPLAIGFYVRHNIGVALAAVALGFTFGAGTLALLVQNGAVAGASIAI